MFCWNASDPLSGNWTAGCSSEAERELYVVLVQFTSIVILTLICVTGNVTLLVIVCRTKHLRIVSNALIVNLSVADLLTSLIVLPAFSASVLRPDAVSGADGGDSVTCTVIGLLSQLLSMEAISTLGTIALDRYVSICHPLRYQTVVTKSKMAAVVGVTWLQSVVIALLPVCGFGRYRFRSSLLPLCSLDLLSNRAFSFLVLCIVIAPSFLVVGLCYGSIFKAARIQARKIFDAEIVNARAQLTPTTTTTTTTTTSKPNLDDHHRRPPIIHPTANPFSLTPVAVSSRAQTAWRHATAAQVATPEDPEGMWMKAVTKIRKSVKQARAAKTVVLILGGFVGCWAPYVLLLVVTLVRKEYIAVYAINFLVTFLAFSSCLVDPVVCILVNRDFWSAFKTVIGWRRRELMRQAVDAFAADSTSASLAGQRDRFFSSYSSMSSADAQEWTIFREKWNTLRLAEEKSARHEHVTG